MSKALITALVHPYIQQRLEALGYAVEVRPEISREELAEIIRQYALLIITTYTVLDQEMIDKAIRLKLIGRVGSGMENVDVAYARQKGIACVNSPEGNANAVGEHSLAMLLSLLNKIAKGNDELKQGLFLREENRGEELDGKTIGIIGFGHTGSAFARKLRGFEVEVLAYDKYVKAEVPNVLQVSLEALQERADIISFHVPYTKETHHYCNTAFIDACAKAPFLINTSRGAVMDTAAVISALEQAKIRGLCVDVFEDEPLTKNKVHPFSLYQRLLAFPNVVATPHIAGWTVESKYKLARILMDKIEGIIKNG